MIRGLDRRTVLKWASLVLSPLILILLGISVWNWQLRRSVSQRTMDLRIANESLSEIKSKYEAVYNHHYLLTGLLDPKGKFLMANRKATIFAGCELEELIGKHFLEMSFWEHSLEVKERVHDAVESALNGQFVQFETTFCSNSGEIRNFEFCLTPVTNSEGKVIYLVPEGYDITDRKRTEEALGLSEEKNKAIVENSPVAMILLDTSGNPYSSNKAFQELLGYTSEELSEIRPKDFVHPDDKDACEELVSKVIEGFSHFDQFDRRYIHKNGEVIWVNLHANLVKDAIGQPDFVIVMIEDITKRKEAEDVMKAQLKELQRWQEVTLGREERMLELKKLVNEQALRLGEPPKFRDLMHNENVSNDS